MKRLSALILLSLVLAACAPHKDPTTLLAAQPTLTPVPALTGPGVLLSWRRKGDLKPAVINIWVEDASQADVITLQSYDSQAYSYASNPYSCFLVGCPCNASCGPANAELTAYWPRFWPKSNYGQLVDAASHATSTYGADTDLYVNWNWKDRNGLTVPNGNYRLWVELSGYPYGASATFDPSLAPTGYVDLVRGAGPGSATGVITQGTALLSLSAQWIP